MKILGNANGQIIKSQNNQNGGEFYKVEHLVNIIHLIMAIFAIFWLIIRPILVPLSEIFKKKEAQKQRVEIEGVSILIPCHNEEEYLEKTVQSLLKQTIHKQIILIENGSTDNTYQVAKMLEASYPEVTVTSVKIPDDQFSISVALNHGLQFVKYPYLLRVDADTQLKDPDTLYTAVEPIYSGRAIATACNVRLSNMKSTILTRIQGIEYFMSMEMDRRSQRIYNGVLVVSGAMQCLRTDLVKKVGGYNLHPWTSEDMDLTLKMHDFGKVEMTPDAISYTDVPATWKGLIKQRYTWFILGFMCMVIHRKSIGRKVGHKGCLGLIALPLKFFSSFQSLVGMFVKGYLILNMSFQDDPQSILISIAYITIIHILVGLFPFIVVGPVAKEKQGCSQWWLIPIFVLVYQPIMGFVRLAALVGSINVLYEYGYRAKAHIAGQYNNVA